MAQSSRKHKVGLIVNPVAGMGGRVGLKGTDGPEILAKAIELGATPVTPGRTVTALEAFRGFRGDIRVITCPGQMGEDAARLAGLDPEVIGSVKGPTTSAEDTLRAAREMEAAGVDLLLFAGGDGTARDIYAAVGDRLPVLGIPAGVKMHSAVFGTTPRKAGELAVRFLEGKARGLREAEVMDIDEAAFRDGRVSARLYGYLRVPFDPGSVQAVKTAGAMGEEASVRAIALDVAANMEQDSYYIIGPGTTTREIMRVLDLPGTLLGVDVVLNRSLVAKDTTEQDLLALLSAGKRKAKIVVTIIGGQGYLFGRGNQQISDRVIAKVGKENIIVIATKGKIFALNGSPLLVDTGNEAVDRMLTGYIQIITGRKERLVYPVSC